MLTMFAVCSKLMQLKAPKLLLNQAPQSLPMELSLNMLHENMTLSEEQRNYSLSKSTVDTL